MPSKFESFMNQKEDALENLNTRKSTPRMILTGILSKNSETCVLKSKFMLLTFQCMDLSIRQTNHDCELIVTVICHT